MPEHDTFTRADANNHPPGPLTDYLDGAEQASDPTAPAASHRALYAKAAGWYDRDSAGTVTPLAPGVAGGYAPLDSGLLVPQAYLPSVIGPVAVSGTPTSGQVPTATSGTAASWQTPSGGGGGGSIALVPMRLAVSMFSATGLTNAVKAINGRVVDLNDYMSWNGPPTSGSARTPLLCDLGAAVLIGQLQFDPYYYDGTAAAIARQYYGVLVESSPDNVTYTTLFDVGGADVLMQAKEDALILHFPTGLSARYVRFSMAGSTANDVNHLMRFAVWTLVTI